MPRGYSEVKTVEQCDASALLNLINSCDCFLSFDVEYVREVKKNLSLSIYILYISKYMQGFNRSDSQVLQPQLRKSCRSLCWMTCRTDAAPLSHFFTLN